MLTDQALPISSIYDNLRKVGPPPPERGYIECHMAAIVLGPKAMAEKWGRPFHKVFQLAPIIEQHLEYLHGLFTHLRANEAHLLGDALKQIADQHEVRRMPNPLEDLGF